MDNFDTSPYWPEKIPNVEKFMHGWMADGNKKILTKLLRQNGFGRINTIIELGSWYGLSAKFIMDKTEDTLLFCVDFWDNEFMMNMWRNSGNSRHIETNPFIKTKPLYETFMANHWENKQRLVPVRMGTIEGLDHIKSLKVHVDLVYIDATHTYDAVKREIDVIKKHFPDAIICGDDWFCADVRKAVVEKAVEYKHPVIDEGNFWIYIG